jgi:hypothetical protein
MHVAEPCLFADGSNPSVCRAPVEAVSVLSSQDRAFVSFADGEVVLPKLDETLTNRLDDLYRSALETE